MESGSIPLAAVPGPFDLQATLESGQTFRWSRPDGQMYQDAVPHGGDAWYRTVVDELAVELRQTADAIEWRAPGDPVDGIREHLRLTAEMAAQIDALPDDDTTTAARAAFPGLHVVDEPFFPTLISFVLSAQMRVERIHDLVQTLSERYGTAHRLGDDTVYAFPDPETLAAVPEADLRELGLGYRAPYVKSTAGMVATGEVTAADVRGRPYEEARTAATQFVGVGEKVADCVLLFSLGYTEPVPLDTWIRSAIADHYPDCDKGSYADTSRAIRERLGGVYAGYAQTYLFYYLRAGGE